MINEILDAPTSIISSPPPKPLLDQQDLWLEVPQEPNDTLVFPLHKGDNLIGQRLDCDIPLLDSYVSRVHGVVRVSPEGVRLIDLGSTNGTLVNSRRINDVPLEAGDVMQVGKTFLVFKMAPRCPDHDTPHVHWRGRLLADEIRKTSNVPIDTQAPAHAH